MFKEGENMTKLKTLKDLPVIRLGVTGTSDHIKIYEGRCVYSREDLRQEAIKWIKSDSAYLNDCDGAVEDWIKYFFNITDSEIQNA